ncbi:hypothetical protein ACOMHN_014791 [Nucella lapillus]
MKWIIIVSVVCVFCTHRVLSGCRNNTFQWWHRFEYNFSLADNSACHDSPCNCSNSTVDCSSLNLTFVPFVGLESYRYLNLSNNSLTHISHRQFFSNVSRDVELMQMEGKIEKVHSNSTVDCSSLNLTFVPFVGLESYLYLNLSNNNLTHISHRQFFSNVSKDVKVIDLFSNGLVYLSPDAFRRFHNLQMLLLGGSNNLTYKDLPTLLSIRGETTFCLQLRERLTALTLSGNPFICDCDILWFQRWMKTNYEIFTDFHSYRYSCANADNITLPDFVLNEQACMLGSDAAAFTISITCVFILFFLLFSLFFRFRWHVRLWLYEACRSRGRQQRRLLRERRKFKYDLFVSYAEENLSWVQHRLIPVLEGQWGLRLCIHQRDFLPGKHIVDNISDCVEDSERILLVFSPFFTRSEWCQFELKLCQTCVMERDDVLVIVTLQTVGSRDMTGAMMAVLRTTTYIEWEDRDVEEGQGQDMFWERMRVAVEDTEGGI